MDSFCHNYAASGSYPWLLGTRKRVVRLHYLPPKKTKHESPPKSSPN